MKVKFILLFVVAIIVISFFGLGYYKFFAPKFEGARREVFEKTRSYNQAKIQELAKYKLEYERATTESEKKALESVIRHKFADYEGELNNNLKTFLKEIRGY